MPKLTKVDLTLLKKLVGELEGSLLIADQTKEKEDSANDYIVEMSKCIGLASGVMAEATALIGDIQSVMATSQGAYAKEDPLSKLLGLSTKGTGSGTPGSN